MVDEVKINQQAQAQQKKTEVKAQTAQPFNAYSIMSVAPMLDTMGISSSMNGAYQMLPTMLSQNPQYQTNATPAQILGTAANYDGMFTGMFANISGTMGEIGPMIIKPQAQNMWNKFYQMFLGRFTGQQTQASTALPAAATPVVPAATDPVVPPIADATAPAADDANSEVKTVRPSGRYTVTKNGVTKYYAANGTEINKKYYESKENVKQDKKVEEGKVETKPQAAKTKVALVPPRPLSLKDFTKNNPNHERKTLDNGNTEITTTNKNVYTFNKNGQMIGIKYADGRTRTNKFNEDGSLASKTEKSFKGSTSYETTTSYTKSNETPISIDTLRANIQKAGAKSKESVDEKTGNTTITYEYKNQNKTYVFDKNGKFVSDNTKTTQIKPNIGSNTYKENDVKVEYKNGYKIVTDAKKATISTYSSQY